jgi:Domain of unknown function (DUF4262)
MRTALDANVEKLDEHERTFVNIIRQHGWHRMNVLQDEAGPGFNYTTGFWLAGFPEIIVFAMKPEIASDVLWDMFRSQKSGQSYPTATVTNEIFADLPACLLTVSKRHYREYLGWNRWFYGGDSFPCLQLVWTDREGNFPWQSGFSSEFDGLQPDLSEGDWTALGLQS